MSVNGRVSIAAGLALLAALWAGPLPDLAATAFSAHMTLHMGVVAVAAPLLAVGLAASPFHVRHSKSVLANPILASAVELVVVWAWHTPALHEAARSQGAIFAVEQGSFLVVGVWLWLAALGGRPPYQQRVWAGVAALLFTSIHMTLLGSLFTFAPRALYGTHSPGAHALADQHLGGGIMLLVGGVSYLVGGLSLARTGLAPLEIKGERS